MVKVGSKVDLLLTFGNQQRFKCPGCKKFMPVTDEPEVICRCGATYAAQGKKYVVVSVPTQESVA